jgi:hypothetical protein
MLQIHFYLCHTRTGSKESALAFLQAVAEKGGWRFGVLLQVTNMISSIYKQHIKKCFSIPLLIVGILLCFDPVMTGQSLFG